MFGSLKVEFPDMSITVGRRTNCPPLPMSSWQVEAAGDKDYYVQEMKFTFQKIGGDWLITRVETVRTLS